MDSPTQSNSGSRSPLARLLQFERLLRQAQDAARIAFLAVNEARKIVDYDYAALLRQDSADTLTLEAVSGLAEVNNQGPLGTLLRQLCATIPADTEALCRQPADVDADTARAWQDLLPEHLIALPLRAHGQRPGVLCYFSRSPWTEAQKKALEVIAEATAHALWALQPRRGLRPRLRGLGHKTLAKVALLIALVALIPVRLSALAPGEVVPLDPFVISAPMDGVIRAVHVQPNQAVQEGEVLFSLDNAALDGRREVAAKARDGAEAELLKTSNKAFSDDPSKAEVSALRARLDERNAELRYVETLLERTEVRAPKAGIAVFGDAAEWIGRPVVTGERVMTIADPARVQLAVYLPAADAISLEQEAEVSLFLNVSPLSSLHARVISASYEATPTAEGVASYLLRARFAAEDELPRIGLRGTAKIYGQRVFLGYYVLRRPLAATRRFLGL
jgi:multidrug efflux pump subunit AcrA (membrane-fusion protein)